MVRTSVFMLINFWQTLISIQTLVMKAASIAADKDGEWWVLCIRRHILSPHFFFCTTYFCLSFQASNDCNLISSSEKASSPKTLLRLCGII